MLMALAECVVANALLLNVYHNGADMQQRSTPKSSFSKGLQAAV